MSLENRKELLDWYENVLALAGCQVNSKGAIEFHPPGEKPVPVLIKNESGKYPMVLPIPSVLSNYNAEREIAFHPIHEPIDTGESPTIRALKTYINVNLNVRLNNLMLELVNIAGSPALQKKLNSEQAELTRAMSDMPEGTLNQVRKLIGRLTTQTLDASWVHISLRRAAVRRGSKRNRVANVHFPVAEQLARINEALNDRKSYDTAIQGTWFIKADKSFIKAYSDLIDFVFPEIHVGEGYGDFSDSHQAPYLEALLRGASVIGERVNELVNMYSAVMAEPDNCRIDLSWRAFKTFAEVEVLASSLSPLRGNMGDVINKATGETVPTPAATRQAEPASRPAQPQPMQPQPTAPRPVPQPQVQQNSATTVTFSDLAGRAPQQPVQPVYPQYHLTPPAPVNDFPVPGQAPQPQLPPLPAGCYWVNGPNGPIPVDQYGRQIQLPQQQYAQPQRAQPQGAALIAAAIQTGAVSTPAPVNQPRPGYNVVQAAQPQYYQTAQPVQPVQPVQQPPRQLQTTDGRIGWFDANNVFLGYVN